jgi:glycosyltransferase 2 family protein
LYAHSITGATPNAAGRSGWLGFAAKAVVSIGILGLIASRIDVAQVGQRIAGMAPLATALALVGCLMMPVLGGLRWWCVLRAIDRPGGIAPLVSLFSVTMVAGQVMPSVAADGLRMWLATRRGYRMQAAAHSVVLERAAMVLTLVLLVLVTRPLLVARIAAPGTAWIAPTLLLAGAGGGVVLLLADHVIAARPRLARWRAARMLAALSGDTRRCVLSRWGAAALVICGLTNLNFVLVAGLLGGALDLRLGIADYLAFIPLVTFATTLPISLSGWGVREGILVALLGAIGAPASGALALSLCFGTFAALAGLPGLLVWWLQRHPSPAPVPGIDRP